MAKLDATSGTSALGRVLPPDDGLSFGEIFRMLRAHVTLIAVCVVVGLTASVAYVRIQNPLYEASATIRIDPSRAASLGLSDMVPTSAGDQTRSMPTEAALIKSNAVALRALNSLYPGQFQEFAGYYRGSHGLPENRIALAKREAGLVQRIQLQTIVKAQEGTQLLDIKFRDRDPQLAAAMANALVHSYILQNFSSRSESVTQLKEWLSSQMDDLRAQVQQSQEKLTQFQKANNIITTTDAHNTTSDRLNQLNEKWTEAQSNRIVKEAQMHSADGVKDPAALASLVQNPQLQALQTERVQISGQYEQLASKFGENYPPRVEKQKQLARINSEIESTIESTQKQLHQEYDAARKSETLFRDQYQQQAGLATSLNSSQATYAQLQADVSSARELYDALQRKSQQATVDTEVNSVETVVVDAARPPGDPVEPKKPLIVLGGFLVGLFAGVLTAFFFEATSDRIQNPERIERALGFSTLTTIPADSTRGRTKLSNDVELVMIQHPLSEDAESYRVLRNSLLSWSGGSAKTFLFAGVLPGEEVSTVAANFAVSLAQMGAKVLVVDTDLRRPSLQERFGGENGSGLGDYLTGKTTSPALRTVAAQLPNLQIITSGVAPAFPSESLASDAFLSILNRWKGSVDYIIFTAAPLLMVSDGLSVAGRTDCTILVAQYNVTTLAALTRASWLLAQINARIAGCVVSGVPKSVGWQKGRAAYGKEYYV